jgi:hypothetical protein
MSKWYHDLMIRAYAKDHLDSRGDTAQQRESFEVASQIASETGLPIGWVKSLMTLGVSRDNLRATAHAVVATIHVYGPPKDTLPSTLREWKECMLGGGIAALGS